MVLFNEIERLNRINYLIKLGLAFANNLLLVFFEVGV